MAEQYPTREQIAEAIRGRATLDEAIDTVLALFPQPTPSAEPNPWPTQGEFAADGTYSSVDTLRKRWKPAAPPSIADMAPGTTSTDAHDDVFQKQVWCFMCPAPSCRLTEYGFEDRHDADNALRDHLAECHD